MVPQNLLRPIFQARAKRFNGSRLGIEHTDFALADTKLVSERISGRLELIPALAMESSVSTDIIMQQQLLILQSLDREYPRNCCPILKVKIEKDGKLKEKTRSKNEGDFSFQDLSSVLAWAFGV